VVKPPTTVEDMIYAGPSEPMSPLEGGPGVGAFGGEGGPTGIEGTTDPAQQAINASILGINSPVGFMLGKGNPVSTILGMAIKGGNEFLGDPLGKAKDFISGKLGLGQSAQGMLGQAGQTAEDAVNAAFEASVPESIDVDVDFPDMSDVAIPSSLADIGIGGAPSGQDAAAIASGQIGPMSGGMEGYGPGGIGVGTGDGGEGFGPGGFGLGGFGTY